ncbi:MAG: 2-succinyl-6-hydroxy-2,4-cyclohexadiene-1-carboxylate synthase [Ilumatobacter coccineus]|uniref:2-succinyl-6-hydroxy-2, 4-cyclohexadiene-1-carboxylate synthase n=1 Tax=Ilumatobacter coccineus TaxID=467094 RepID=A0A2G6KBM1_9ACTN|nr:MAG: 2-succinyl-6-hydroxy-2,4-cyclohexadiene-1-carboxylate synthase [Ilumatobacter coccineus]
MTPVPADEHLVLLHGFTQTHRHWHHTASLITKAITPPPRLTFVDLAGHGLSSDDRPADIVELAGPVIELAGPGTYVGYSMGGRVALTAAVQHPGSIKRLVVIGATAGLDTPDERHQRIAHDDALANQVVAEGVDAFLDRWLTAPLFAGLPPDPTGDIERRRNTEAGLAHSLRSYGTGTMTPLWDRLGEVEIPVLVLAGEHDNKFTALGQRLAQHLPSATFDTIADAGHAAHLEQPVATATRIVTWLTTTARGSSQR